MMEVKSIVKEEKVQTGSWYVALRGVAQDILILIFTTLKFRETG